MLNKTCLALILVCSLILWGCWDAQDLDKLNLPSAGAYDLHAAEKTPAYDPEVPPGDKRIDVTILAPNLDPESKSPVDVQTISGINASDVRQKRGLTDAGVYVTGLVQTIIVGEKLASQGLNPYFDNLLRATTIRRTMHLAIAEGRGEDILNTPTKDHTSIGTFLQGLFDEIHQRTLIPAIQLGEFFRRQAIGKNPIVPILKSVEDRVTISGTAIFRKDRLVKKLSIDQSKNLVLLRGIKSTCYQAFDKDIAGKKHLGSVLVSNSRKVQYVKNQQGHTFLITIKLAGNLEEHSHQAPVTAEHLKEIEKAVEEKIKNECTAFIKMMQDEIKVDCIDILKYALAKNRRALEKVIDQPEFIQKANIQVKVKVHLKSTGEMC